MLPSLCLPDIVEVPKVPRVVCNQSVIALRGIVEMISIMPPDRSSLTRRYNKVTSNPEQVY